MSFWLALILLAVAAVAYVVRIDGEALKSVFPDGRVPLGVEAQDIVLVATAAAVILLVVPGLFGGYRGRAGRAFRDLLGWTAIVIGGLGVYNYRDELGQIAYRIAGELGQPGVPQQVEVTTGSERSVRMRRRKDGHFTASVAVNGASVPMLVDTGASTVVLRLADAKKLGVDTAALKFSVPVQTANGVAYAAHVRLRNVSVGSISLGGVDALVAQPGALKESLLGMSFLSRLRSYEFSGQFLTFRN